LSFPNQWSTLGDASVALGSTAWGGSGTIHRHSSAETTQNSTMPKPTRNVLE
jgi:hypothetical protein